MLGRELPAGVRAGEVVVAGVRSPVLEAGPAGAAEAVVFVHGNPGSGHDWTDLMARVAPFARAVAPDMPGFGRADKPRDFPYTVEGYARHLAGLLDDLGIRRAHLVLHDFGGPWGLVWAATNQDRVGSVTLINTGVMLGYRWHTAARLWRTPVVGELVQALSTRVAVRRSLERVNPRGLPQGFAERMAEDYDRGTKRAVLRLYRATSVGGAGAERLSAALRPLGLPALVVWGAKDPFIPVEQAERQRVTFPDAEVVVLPESGHWPFADDPDGVAAAVVPFLRRAVAPDRGSNQHQAERAPGPTEPGA